MESFFKQNELTEAKISWFSSFLENMYLSYYILDSEEKKDILLNMDYTYDNWKIKSYELMKNFKERTKKIFPQIVHFCLDDDYFLLHMQIFYRENFRYDNFVVYIRVYFIFRMIFSYR